MTVAKFKVHARLDNAGPRQSGTVIIDRAAGLVTVRPHRRRKTYELLLDDVADMIVERVLLAEAREQRRARAARRRGKKARR